MSRNFVQLLTLFPLFKYYGVSIVVTKSAIPHSYAVTSFMDDPLDPEENMKFLAYKVSNRLKDYSEYEYLFFLDSSINNLLNCEFFLLILIN